jgi:glycosyltransferase involved in cell wall biosynthesis
MTVALVHDYLTQRGGAERVVLSMVRAFPDAPLHTSFYDARATFPEYASVDVRTLPIDRIAPLRTRHRLALPLLARAFDRLLVDADVTICSTSGWAHGARATGRKIVYCHAPARWLYQSDTHGGVASHAALALLGRRLRAWDARAAHSADLYLVNSTATRARVRAIYGIDAEVLHPPMTFSSDGDATPVDVEPGYVLCVARLLPYKNVDAVVRAFESLRGERLVVVGDGPALGPLRRTAPSNVTLLGRVDDSQLRWLYGHASALVAASYEDFGLTPLEAASFGIPTAALAGGGYLDTIVDGETGVFFSEPAATSIADALRRLLTLPWAAGALRAHAERFSEAAFIARLRELAAP